MTRRAAVRVEAGEGRAGAEAGPGSADVWIRLAHLGMHPDRLRGLLELKPPAAVLRAVERGRVSVPAAARREVTVPAEDRREMLRRAGIEFLLRSDGRYPAQLRDLPDAPPYLFQRGADFRGPAVAVVGTRSCTGYGRRLAECYGRELSRAGWKVVSGLARGIDGAAHQGSLQGPVPGAAVLGSGVDVWYPRRHEKLGEKLLEEGGTVWSESPPGTRPLGWRFPPRNRIISGVSHAVVVVEAGQRGGALVTARIALEQGRDVFATPGDVGRASSVGTNLLIRDGAFPVHEADDLVECLETAFGPPAPPPSSEPPDEGGSAVAVPDAGAPVAEFLAGLGSDPAAAVAELGRLVSQGEVVMEGGLVLARRGR